MLVAAFIAHGSDPFGKKELALLYLVIFIFLLFTGSGKYSVDYLISQKSK
jgi:putative oxidoreductase